MIDLANFTEDRLIIVAELMAGNPKPLAKHLANGGELYGDLRVLLVQFLEGKIRNSQRGQRRHSAANFDDLRARQQLQALQYRFALIDGRYRSYSRAIAAYAEMTGMDTEAVKKKYAKGGLLPDAFLEAIDKARES